jgi:hypothetical protein
VVAAKYLFDECMAVGASFPVPEGLLEIYVARAFVLRQLALLAEYRPAY